MVLHLLLPRNVENIACKNESLTNDAKQLSWASDTGSCLRNALASWI
jgi:hypothetical protein